MEPTTVASSSGARPGKRVNAKSAKFLQECEAEYDNVWSTLHCSQGFVAACSTQGTVTLALSSASQRIEVTSGVNNVTSVALVGRPSSLDVFVGDDSGEVRSFAVHFKDLQQKWVAKVQLPVKSPVLNIVSLANKAEAWIVQAGVVSLIRNHKLVDASCSLIHSADATFLSAQASLPPSAALYHSLTHI
jgi:hypothetical protein